MTNLEARVRKLEDRAELYDLIVRYFVAADGDDYATLADCFTADGEFRAGGVAGGATREEVVDGIRQARSAMGLTIHTPNYQLLTSLDADSAAGVVGAHLELALAGEGLFGAVRYFDQYARTSEGWQIRQRVMRTVHIGPWSEVEDILKSPTPVRWPGGQPSPTEIGG